MRYLSYIWLLTCIWSSAISQELNQGQLYAGPTEDAIHIDYAKTLNHTLTLVDDFVIKTYPERFTSFENLAIYLTQPFNDERSKVRSIYTWIALNISYDQNSLKASVKKNQTAESVWQNRIAVCEGYANLFSEMCKSIGIESRIIKGYVKNFTGNDFKFPNHAWNAVKIRGKWELLDVTWASVNNEGSFLTNKNVKNNIDRHKLDIFFLVHPKRMILTHLPEDPYWQLQNNFISMDIFREGDASIKSTLMNADLDDKNFEILIAEYERLDSLDKSIAYLERMEINKLNKVKEYGLGIAYYYKAQKILREARNSNKYQAIKLAKMYYQKSLDQLSYLGKEDFGYEFSRDLANNVAFRIETLQ